MKRVLSATAILAVLSSGVAHAEGRTQIEDLGGKSGETYRLGEVVVTARDRTGRPTGGAVIRADAIERIARTGVDQALDLLPGVGAVSTGGSRNERYASIRGFDRFQTTLSIDGVRVFSPADLILGARNLFDKTYMPTDEYPEAARSIRLDLKARF